ncbi:MAG: type II toxin-antitoxin system ParD family antitoxin [Sandaracinaceae bacterium]|nr:type II toxin-antitoxin system ParD family antitoxin [Sandaracinaceae bacterium]
MATPVKNTSFVLDAKLREFIREQVDQGGYRSASEVVRDALERLADDKAKEAALLAALDHGVASGRAAPGVFARARAGGASAPKKTRAPAKKRRASR